MRLSPAFSLAILAFALGACEESKTIEVGGAPVDCKVTLNNLAGTQWVMHEAMPDKTDRPNPRARMRFYQGDQGLKVDYSVGSPYEMHTYDCQVGPREMKCAEEAKVVDWCLSLEAHQAGSCSPAKLRELGATGIDDSELADAVSKARKEIAAVTEQAKDNPQMLAQYKLARNNLGNKLQGLLDLRVNEKRCQLVITDQYMTIYNGQKIVDSNPVGTNPFVQDKDNTWLWENCVEGTKFLAFPQETPPTDEEIKGLDPKRQFSSKDTVNYHYIGVKHLEAKEGCTYSADTWVQWKPAATGLEIATYDCNLTIPDPAAPGDASKARPVKKCVKWHAAHQWTDVSGLTYVADDAAIPRAFFGMTRYEQCDGGEKKKLDTVCAAARIVD
jgi:hypothetical protein